MAIERSGMERPLAFRSTSNMALAGLEDGLLAGMVMLLFAMLCWAVMGDTFATPLRLIASTFLGPGALARDHLWVPLILGLLIHFGLSVAFSELFASMLGPSTLPRAALWGVLYGLGIAVFMRFVVLPLVNPTLAMTSLTMFFLAHLIFGLGLAFFPVFFRASEPRERITERTEMPVRHGHVNAGHRHAKVSSLPKRDVREPRQPLH